MFVAWYNHPLGLPGLLILTTATAAVFSYLIARNGRPSGFWKRSGDLGAVQASHTTDAPRLGGFAILASFLAAVLVTEPSRDEFVLISSGLIVFLVGAHEDLSGSVSARRRLIASILAAGTAIFLSQAGITRLDAGVVDKALVAIPIASVLLTVLFSAAYTHAFNLIDGMNGLSSAVGISTALALAWTASVHGQEVLSLTSLFLAAAIFGFSMINWPRGRIFLGDGGAYFIGHALFWIAVMLAATTPSISIAAILLMMFWPVAELSFTMVRRAARREPLGQPDRLHIHQIVRRGIEIGTRGREIRPIANALTTLVMLPAIIVPPLLGASLSDQRTTALFFLVIGITVYGATYVALLRLASRYRSRRAIARISLPFTITQRRRMDEQQQRRALKAMQ